MREVEIGLRGENLVVSTLQEAKDLDVRIFRNFPLMNDSQTGYYQVDVVLLCNRGLYALEVKNWECTVECSTSNIYWKTIYPTREIMVKSPLLQNKIHCKFLCNIIKRPVYNVIVFSDKTIIKDRLESVIKCIEIASFIKKHPIIYDADEVDQIGAELLAYKNKHDERLLLDFFCKALNRVYPKEEL